MAIFHGIESIHGVWLPVLPVYTVRLDVRMDVVRLDVCIRYHVGITMQVPCVGVAVDMASVMLVQMLV